MAANTALMVVFFCSITALAIEESQNAIAILTALRDTYENGIPPWNITYMMNPEERGPGSDILVFDDSNGVLGRSALKDVSRRWPNATIPYIIDSSFESKHRDMILRAMNIIHYESCIRFVPHSNETAYIDIENSLGCKSHIGHFGQPQKVYLKAADCFSKIGSVLHELLHTVGFIHEHSRPDRDNYIYIYTMNALPPLTKDFEKLDKEDFDDFGIPYDYNSIMHYSEFAGSYNWHQTIEPKDIHWIRRLGQRDKLSDSDIVKMNLLYDCPNVLVIPLINSEASVQNRNRQ